MLNEEEMAAFVALVVAFHKNVSLSNRATASLLRVSPTALNRWMTGDYEHGAYRHIAGPVIDKIERLNKVHAKVDLYTNLKEFTAAVRLHELEVALQNNPSC
jgi:hypothetical protein